MSFSASAKRARDAGRPIGIRVSCLHQCLERFSLFGYHATRTRLRAMQRVGPDGWSGSQVVAAVDALESAHRSWMRFLRDRQVRQREARRAGAPPLDLAAVWVEWRDWYLQGAVAEEWLVAGLGDCAACGHGLIHHGREARYACGVCSVRASPVDPADWAKSWAQRCTAPLPPPAGYVGDVARP